MTQLWAHGKEEIEVVRHNCELDKKRLTQESMGKFIGDIKDVTR